MFVHAVRGNIITQATKDICEFDTSHIGISSHMFLATQTIEKLTYGCTRC